MPDAHFLVVTNVYKIIHVILLNRRPESIYKKIQIPTRLCKVTTLNMGMTAQQLYFNIGLRVFSKMLSHIKLLKGHKLKSALKNTLNTPDRARDML